MENRKPGHISEKELDDLLNESFLNIEFEGNAVNEKVLGVITRQFMAKNIFSRFFTAYRIDLFVLFLSAFVFLNSLYRFVERPLASVKNEVVVDPMKTPAGIKKSSSVQPEKKTVATFPSAKKKHVPKSNRSRHKKYNQAVASVIPSEIKNSDPVPVEQFPPGIVTESGSTGIGIDSSANSQEVVPVASVVPVKRRVRPVRDTMSVAAKKGKKEIKRKRFLFHRDGTLIMRGNTYRKSRLR